MTRNKNLHILLDTNALIWFAHAPHKLGPEAKNLISNASRRFISSISILEIVIKTMNGRLDFPSKVDEITESLKAEYINFDQIHANGLKDFPTLSKHDPFDRMLLSQAKTENLMLLTSDEVLLSFGYDFVVDSTK